MPRKAKITVVPIDVQPDQTLEEVDDQVFTHRVADQREPKTEAEQMTDVINEVNVNEVESPVTRAVQTAPKAKAKRVSKKEPVFTEPEVEVTSSLDEVQAEVVMPNQEPYVESKVACPDCGKKMSAKTLKYSHGPNCVIQKQKQQMPSEDSSPNEIERMQSVSNEWIEHEVQRRLNGRRDERANRREAMVANLLKNAF